MSKPASTPSDPLREVEHAVLPVCDPATDQVVGEVPCQGPADVADAVDRAASAQPDWARRPTMERAEIVSEVGRRLREDDRALSRLITAEQGKPLGESEAEIAYAASFFEVAAAEIGAIVPEEIVMTGKRATIEYRPMGVTAAITPWNFPLAMLAKKAAAALATGCGQIVKPAEQTPLTAIRFAEIAASAGVPDGIIQILTGDPDPLGDAILRDPRVRRFSFTGSTEVGRLLMSRAARQPLPVSLELGGHAPLLVFDDADLDRAIEVTMAAKFRNAGQTCIAPNRILLQSGIHDRYVEALSRRAAALTSGRGVDGVDLGPLIDDAAVAKVETHVGDAEEHGGDIVLGGGRRSLPGLADRFPEPTIILGADPRMLCWREETFGPVCPIRRFETAEEGIRLANDSSYGLAAYVVCGSASQGARIAQSLEYGIVGVNDGLPAVAQVPFGGVKHSGFGREGGRLGLHEYLVPTTISRVD